MELGPASSRCVGDEDVPVLVPVVVAYVLPVWCTDDLSIFAGVLMKVGIANGRFVLTQSELESETVRIDHQRSSGTGSVGSLVPWCLLQSPMAIVAHPMKRGVYWALDWLTVRVLDESTGLSQHVAGMSPKQREAGGSLRCPAVDGVGSEARFRGLCGGCCTADGGILYVTENELCDIRAIHTSTNRVWTVCGDGKERNVDGAHRECSVYSPRQIAWAAGGQDQVMWITTHRAIRRLDVRSGVVTTLTLPGQEEGGAREYMNLWALQVIPSSGVLLVSCGESIQILAIDPHTKEIEAVAGTGEPGAVDGDGLTRATFREVMAMCITAAAGGSGGEGEHELLVCDRSAIRRVTLPPHLWYSTPPPPPPPPPKAVKE